MSLKKYLEETTPGSIASEIGFYTPLATHLFGALLGYPPKQRIINKSGEHGIPDIRLYSKEDNSEWIIVEAKRDDAEIRNEERRARLWKEQIIGHRYISPETFYVILCAPRTFYVCDLDSNLLEAIHLDDNRLLNPGTGAEFPLSDKAFRELAARVSYAASLERHQFEAFRRGELHSGHIRLTAETLSQLQGVFVYSIEKLKEYCLSRLFFVRICEDSGLTTRKISNSGIAVWRDFVQNIKGNYQDLLEVAFKDVAHVYSSLFEASVFDWFGKGNGLLHDILERILFRLNAFSFRVINRDLLGSIYQYFRPRIERKRLGEYYTPVEVVDFILARTGIATDPLLMQKRILDPACGSFTFGVRAAIPLLQAGSSLSPQNRIDLVRTCLRGQDINPFSVFLSHLSLLFALLDIYSRSQAARSPVRNQTHGCGNPELPDCNSPRVPGNWRA